MQVRAKVPFTPEMLNEVEQYYFGTHHMLAADAAPAANYGGLVIQLHQLANTTVDITTKHPCRCA